MHKKIVQKHSKFIRIITPTILGLISMILLALYSKQLSLFKVGGASIPNASTSSSGEDCSTINQDSFKGLSDANQRDMVLQCLKYDKAQEGKKPSYCGNSERGYYFEHLDKLQEEYKNKPRDATYNDQAKFHSCLGAICTFPDRSDLGTIQQRILECYGLKAAPPPAKPAPSSKPKQQTPILPTVIQKTPPKTLLPTTYLDKINYAESQLRKLPDGSSKVLSLTMHGKNGYKLVRLTITSYKFDDKDSFSYTIDNKHYYASYEDAFLNRGAEFTP